MVLPPMAPLNYHLKTGLWRSMLWRRYLPWKVGNFLPLCTLVVHTGTTVILVRIHLGSACVAGRHAAARRLAAVDAHASRLQHHTQPPLYRKTDRQPCYSNLLVYFTYTSTVLNQLQGGRTVQAEHIQRICAVFLGVLYDSLKRKQQQLVNPVRKICFLEFF